MTLEEWLTKHNIALLWSEDKKLIKFFEMLKDAEESEAEQLEYHEEEMTELPRSKQYDFEYHTSDLDDERAYTALQLLRGIKIDE